MGFLMELTPEFCFYVIRSDEAKISSSPVLSSSILEAWSSLAPEVRAALIATEKSPASTSTTLQGSSASSITSDENSDKTGQDGMIVEECPDTGSKVVMRPLERAPNNVFEIEKTTSRETTQIKKTPASTVTTKTTIVTGSKGWRNVFTLPISYDVNMVPNGTLLDPSNLQMLEATGVHPEGYNRRFAVVDEEIEKIYGSKITEYFVQHGIELTKCILKGGEPDKRPAAVDDVLDQLCAYKLRRREPFLAIGGGVLLDIAGMAACLYRRGVPFVRVPTTLLAIVDASVGVKNGVDYCCGATDETYKNRVGSFYAPSSCLLDTSFIASQDIRNVSNGFGEILKLALVRSVDLFQLLETHGDSLIRSRFSKSQLVPDGVSDRVVDLSIQIMLEELGPNLWEKTLERCVDYGTHFLTLLETLIH
jgi:3-dehydroquinate synthase